MSPAFKLHELKLIGLAIFLGLTPCSLARLTREEEQRLSYIREKTNGFNRAELPSLSPEDKAFVRRCFRDQYETDAHSRAGDPRRVMEDWFHLALVGDEDGWDYLVKSFEGVDRECGDFLAQLEDPDVIPRVGELLFKDDEAQLFGGDYLQYPVQRRTQILIAQTLVNAPEFSPEMRTWGAASRNGKGGLQIMRDWYRQNESALKARDWQAVVPGGYPEPELPPPPQSAAGPTSAGIGAAKPPRAPKANAENSSKLKESWLPAALIGGGALAAVAGLLLFRSRRRGAASGRD